MITIEITLMIIAYTLIILSIFLEVLCYRKNLETIETIWFTVSLLLLIVSLTASPFLGQGETLNSTSIFTLLAMNAVALTTPLNIFSERKINISILWKKVLAGLFVPLCIAVCMGYFYGYLDIIQYGVVAFLGTSITLSMLLVRNSKPQARFAHREKTERIFAVAFMVLVPLSLLADRSPHGPSKSAQKTVQSYKKQNSTAFQFATMKRL